MTERRLYNAAMHQAIVPADFLVQQAVTVSTSISPSVHPAAARKFGELWYSVTDGQNSGSAKAGGYGIPHGSLRRQDWRNLATLPVWALPRLLH
jgi:hypothetical protein